MSLSLLNFCEVYNFGAHPLAMDAHSGNARGGSFPNSSSKCNKLITCLLTRKKLPYPNQSSKDVVFYLN